MRKAGSERQSPQGGAHQLDTQCERPALKTYMWVNYMDSQVILRNMHTQIHACNTCLYAITITLKKGHKSEEELGQGL